MKCSLDFKREIKEEVIDYLELNASHRDTTYAINPKLVTKSEIKYINDYFKDEVVKKINDTTITIEPSIDLIVNKQEAYHKALKLLKAPEQRINYTSQETTVFEQSPLSKIVDEDCQ
jgi:hypothetical protein